MLMGTDDDHSQHHVVLYFIQFSREHVDGDRRVSANSNKPLITVLSDHSQHHVVLYFKQFSREHVDGDRRVSANSNKPLITVLSDHSQHHVVLYFKQLSREHVDGVRRVSANSNKPLITVLSDHSQHHVVLYFKQFSREHVDGDRRVSANNLQKRQILSEQTAYNGADREHVDGDRRVSANNLQKRQILSEQTAYNVLFVNSICTIDLLVLILQTAASFFAEQKGQCGGEAYTGTGAYTSQLSIAKLSYCQGLYANVHMRRRHRRIGQYIMGDTSTDTDTGRCGFRPYLPLSPDRRVASCLLVICRLCACVLRAYSSRDIDNLVEDDTFHLSTILICFVINKPLLSENQIVGLINTSVHTASKHCSHKHVFEIFRLAVESHLQCTGVKPKTALGTVRGILTNDGPDALSSREWIWYNDARRGPRFSNAALYNTALSSFPDPFQPAGSYFT
ncbi:hypothetical protein J6590_001785 [Homalodisca vitripennis]|nr:hypothetical protein J6590_001785 [Homalodisca vitripennis]